MTRITDPDFRLRDHYTPPTLPALPKTGLNLATLHKPALKLSDYIHAELANPPAAVSRPHAGFQWGMLANDTHWRLRDRDDAPLDRGLPPRRRHPAHKSIHRRRRDRHLLGDHRLRPGRSEPPITGRTRALPCATGSIPV